MEYISQFQVYMIIVVRAILCEERCISTWWPMYHKPINGNVLYLMLKK